MSVVDTASGAGLRFRGAPRAGRVGHWWRAYAADGTVRGALRVNPKMIAAPGAVDRVATTAGCPVCCPWPTWSPTPVRCG